MMLAIHGMGFLVGAIALLELVCAGFVTWRDRCHKSNQLSRSGSEISRRCKVDYPELAREMAEIYYEKPRYHPSQWYALPPNFKGTYVSTDAFGLRVDRTKVAPEISKVLFFGGSTMFSTTTRDYGTIPEAINRYLDLNKVVALNYGVGGHSTYAELAAFCDALRREDNVSIAIFYDGVNEVGRYVEMVQDQPDDHFYSHAGYPYMPTTRVALGRHVESAQRAIRLRSYSLELIHRTFSGIKSRLGGLNNSSPVDSVDAFSHAVKIANAYIANVRMISGIAKAHGVTPVFIWQPDIFTTRKRLTSNEREVYGECPDFMAQLTVKAKNLVTASRAMAEVEFIDATRWLDKLDGEHFFDYCHVSEEANEALSAQMVKLLRDKLPQEFWKH